MAQHPNVRRRSRGSERLRAIKPALMAALATLLATTLIMPLVPAQQADAAEPLVFALIEIAKDADPAATTRALTPGENVEFNIDVSCSSTQTDCVSMKLQDAMPEPLELISVSNSPYYTQSITGNAFELTFTTPLDEGGIGLQSGELVTVTVTARVPLDADAAFNGQTLTNTAYVTVDNPDSNVQDDAQVLLEVPLDLASTITKTITPAAVTGFPGTPINFDLVGANSSNSAVDTLMIQDPAEPASNAFDYLQVTGLTNVVFPSGANRVQVDWYDGTTWTTGTPAATASLPSGVATSLIKGLRLTFSNSNPATDIALGASGSFRIATETTANVSTLTSDFTGTNLASSQVRFGVDSNTPVLDSEDFVIRRTAITPIATKDFNPNAIVGGEDITVTIGGENGGDFNLSRMTLTEPKTGSTSLEDQGISFSEWITGASGIEWPTGATAAEITYLYEIGGWGGMAASTTTIDTLPAPDTDKGKVLGFAVSFTGNMPHGAYAALPYVAHTETVSAADADLTTRDTIEVEVETIGGETDTADAFDDLTRRSTRIDVITRKIISPSSIFAVPGASALLSLPTDVAPLPPASPSSTVGATILTVTDNDPEFWEKFNATSIIATDVPATSTMTVRYWDGTAWLDFPSPIVVVGSNSVTIPIPTGLRDTIAGLQFEFVPTNPTATLPPGFSVQPNIRVALRDTIRGTATPVVAPGATDPIIINNTVDAVVENPVATPPTAEDGDVDSITVIPVDGDGPTMIDKNWDDSQVRARSGDLARLGISWGTGGLQYDSVVVTDTATDPAAGGWNVADTVFEAFDLYSIPAITTGMDPLLQYDAIESVELYIQGSGWVPTATNPCAGTACYGTFPGYTLTTFERENALGVRFVVVENPNRTAPTSSNPGAPSVGSGVASAVELDRDIDLVFQVRDVRRSNGEAVLGNTRGAIYNMVDAGRVDNTARVVGLDVDNNVIQDDTAADDILIVDRPISVTAAKNWFVVSDASGATSDSVGVPQIDTDPVYYPEARMVVTGTNISVVRVNELSLAEPSNGTTPFDYFDVSDIVSITVPSGATDSVVTLTRDGAAATTHTIAQALALSSSNLANVVGIEVVHTGRINTNASTTITLDTKLRKFVRGTTDLVEPLTLTDPRVVGNTVTATVKDPSGTTTPSVGTDNVVTAIASDPINIEAQEYGVLATKTITADTTSTDVSPAIQYDESSTTARITLTGQPTGNVRTTKLIIEDSNASFWNAYNFSAFGPADAGPVSPAERVQVDALVDNIPGSDLEYVVDGSNNITTECGGSAVLDDCWVLGSSNATLQLPAGVAVADIRGLRFTYTKADLSNWERPYNPIQRVVFTVDRRDTLVAGSPLAANDDVPSTLFNYDAPANDTVDRAPGEATRGTFTNHVDVTAIGGPVDDPTKQWIETDADLKQILFQHLPARVEIKKSPLGLQYLGADIPYTIDVINRGGVHERDLGNIIVTDTIPVDATGPQLVIPNDPDTGVPYLLTEAFSYELRNASNVLQTAPTVTATEGPATVLDGKTYTFTMTTPATLPKGWTLRITAPMQLRAQFETGIPVVNTATVTADQRFDTCDSFSNVTEQKPQELNVLECSSDTWVQAIASAPMTVVKGVRGVGAGPLDTTDPNNYVPLIDPDAMPAAPFDDLGILKTVPASSVDCSAPNVATGVTNEYYRYPCVPITRPGGIEEWAATFTNGGNIDVVRIAAIDVLPRANDRGVIVNEARSSKWTPLLTTMPELVGGPSDAVLSVEYITDAAQIATRCNATDIQAELGMTASSSPAVTTPSCLTGTGVDDIPQRDWLPLNQGIIDASGESIVALKLVITSATGLIPGQKVSVIYRSKTAPAPEIAESATGLDRDSIAYNSIATAALGDDNGTPTPNRFVIEPRKVGVGMATGGVELAKIVDGANSGAAYLENDYNISLTCTSDGEPFDLRTSAGVLRNPFTIARGAAATLIQGLPLYAKCDVSEANYGSVQSITPSQVIAQAAQTTEYDMYDANPDFGLGGPRPAIERSTVTNTYEYAGFTVTKTINNGGAVNQAGTPIAYDNFPFSAVCTFFDGVTTNTVLNTTFTLTAASATRSFTNLPAGAECTVTETNNRAAASTTVTSTGGTNTTLRNSSTGPTVNARVVTTLTANSGVAKDVIVNEMGFTNTYTVGSLRIDKVLAGLGATQYGTGNFTINMTCTRAISSGSAVTVWSGAVPFTFNSPSNLSYTINNLPTGASCQVTEPSSAGATSVAISPSGNVTVGTTGSTVVKTVTNTFDLASLVVTKNVITDALDESADRVVLDSPFVVRVACTFQGASVYAAGFDGLPMVLTLDASAPGNTQTLTGLPANASCVVSEDAPTYTNSTDILFYRGAPLALVSTDTDVLISRALSLTRDVSGSGRNAVSVNNNYGVGSFTVTKEILGAGADQFVPGAPYADAEFDVHITCEAPNGSSAYDDVVTLSYATPTVTITTIAADSECSAVETNAATSRANATVYRDGDGVEIASGETINVSDPVVPSVITIENWYLTGSVDVTKTVGGAAATTFGDGPFEVTLTCTLDATDDSVDNPVAVVVLNPVRAILDGETETFTRLPQGAECVLTETDTGSATSSFIVRDGSATREDTDTGYSFTIDEIVDTPLAETDQVQKGFDIQNDFEFAELAVSKDVISAARINNVGTDPVYYGTFAVTVDCTFNGNDVYADGYDVSNPMENLALEDGDVWTLTDLPFGAVCTIEETDAKGSVDPYIVTTRASAPPVTSLGTSTVLTLETTNTAVVTNPYEVGSIELSKALIGAGVSAWGNEKFIVDVVCTLTDSTTPTSPRETWNSTYEFQRDAGSGDILPTSVVLENIAAGSVCEITESGAGAANDTSITIDSGTPVVATTASVAVVADETHDVVVTNSFDLSEIDVNKVITGPGAALYGAGPFEVTITCTRDVNGTTVTIPDADIPGGPTRWLRDDTTPIAYVANYSGLPRGAECEIVETQIGGADQAGTVIEAGVGVEGPFVLGATASDVTVTNFFGDPTVNVRKLFDGSPDAQALYGAGPFQVMLECTRVVNGDTIRVPIPYAASTTDVNDDPYRTLDAGNGYEASYEFLPTRADCVLTETQTGGAISSVVTPNPADYLLLPNNGFELGDDLSVGTVDVTNTFAFSNFSLTKRVIGTDAGANLDKTFIVEIACELDVNGTMQPITIRDDAERSFKNGETVTWEELPAGAECTVTETDDGGASAVALSYRGAVMPATTVTLVSGDSTAVLSNTFLLALTGSEVLPWILVGGQLFLVGIVFMFVGDRKRRSAELAAE